MAHLPRRSLCIEAELWDAFGNAVKATSPELTRSMALRELIRWWCDPSDASLRIGYPPVQEKTL